MLTEVQVSEGFPTKAEAWKFAEKTDTSPWSRHGKKIRHAAFLI
jgi:hypothetical protein